MTAKLETVADARPSILPTRPESHQRPTAEGLASWLSQIDVAVIEVDGDGRIIRMNAAAERLTGWSLAETRGAAVDEVVRVVTPDRGGDVDDDGEREEISGSSLLPELFGAAPTGGDDRRHQTALIARRDGELISIRHTAGMMPARGGEGAASPQRVLLFREVTAAEEAAQSVRSDSLTHLLDRRSIIERIDVALQDCRTSGATYALCYIDLDSFRLVNATCGHEAGDDLLQWVATRVNEVVGPNDAAGRIGGDEFALLLAGRGEREAERIAKELQLALLEFRFGWAEKTFSIGASIGLVVIGPQFERAADVLSAADYACRVAKENGRGRLQVYLDDDKMAASRRSMQWVASLQRHLSEGRLRLYAQGIYRLSMLDDSPNSVEGRSVRKPGAHFEVLVRQVDEDGRAVSPVGIIHAAEQSGLMHVIDRYVVRQALRMIGALPPAALRRLDTCSINLSGVSLLREGLLDFLVEQLHRAQVPPSKICFEITETAALANLGEVLWFMQEIGAMGCRFAIDDFGSGHASYGYLESLPVDYVKIDGMFIRDLADNSLHRAIVESVQRIGATLGIKTVAEQVENELISNMLRDMGIHYGQGWHFARPRPLLDLCNELREGI
ncbi:putative bifunctional diguanylate cyclase/phosphodiesterase [Chondromyces crocatus]|uniref:Sensory hisitidine kinase n=1 Tax=Chondromyces crocatus TaxID=52 RepID=A0A0K1EJA6_CHOCO|nr:EAL domain-containing protein [Chondromyces crocatus]AKT40762.1 sensory hisitidine kinase [Chondromyces crocatus]